MILAILLASLATPAAQPALPNGWSLHKLTLVNAPEGLACTATHAYVRNWSGDVAVWDGALWSSLPRQTESAYGRTLAASPDGHVFLEAGAGIREWDGTTWRAHSLDRWDGDGDAQLIAPSATEVYYVGNGRIARRTTTGFGTYSAGTWRALTAVALVGDDLWVGGQGGTILRLHQSTWTRLDTQIDRWIRRILALAPNDVWALADGETYNRSTVLHWTGRSWLRSDQGLPQEVTVNSIGGAADALYAVGDFGLMRWSGTTWQPELGSAALGEGYHALDEVCATDRHILVTDRGGHVLTRAR